MATPWPPQAGTGGGGRGDGGGEVTAGTGGPPLTPAVLRASRLWALQQLWGHSPTGTPQPRPPRLYTQPQTLTAPNSSAAHAQPQAPQ